ncbi:hypothetical protein KPH14_002243 [Odynerus spinipes]|uniref:Cytochrome P450 n=1 Tax=Odynerus spinipes TaxID=1348599 RepID=A0AAD9VPB7_9HYME|nr:hypothetical protein KPH14_002243 [Odynerus spinipes]
MEPLTVILTTLIIGLGLYTFFLRSMSYFKEKGIPHVPPLPVFGNMAPSVFRRKAIPILLDELYNKFSNVKYFGFYDFMKPVIVVRDPEIIHSITIKNFNNFSDHATLFNEHETLVKRNLFALKGDTWREMRKILSPTFTSSKMKMMFELVQECGENFVNHVAKKAEDGWIVNMKDILVRYTNDAVATTAFGISIDSMKNPNNDFISHVTKALNFDSILSLKLIMGKHFPRLFKTLNIQLFAESVSSFFCNVVKDNVKMREEKGIVRPDMIQLMMESREKSHMTYEDMAAQAFIFFLAGSDSTGSFLCFLAHELAVNTEVQTKLREEVDRVLQITNGKPTYDAIINLEYLNAVVNETLRLYPLSAFSDRYCVKTFELPPMTPEGKPLTVTPGTNLWFLPYSLHRDSKYFPDPEKFDPERFLNGNSVDPTTYIPFGIGPRSCIGNRYALLLSKVVFFHLVARCELEPCSKTSIPMKLSKKSFVMAAENGFWLNIKARKTSSSPTDK